MTHWSSREAQLSESAILVDYRFSEDLDFSTLKGIPTGNEMERLIGEVCGTAVRLLDEYAPVEITL